MYDYYEEPYYEPSVADEILIEFQQKMKDVLLESIKSEIKSIAEENSTLRAENKKLKEKQHEVDRRERDLKYKEDNLKREVEKEFYQSNIGDTLKQYIEDCEIWFADVERYQNKKCDLCNEERELIVKFPNGKITKTDCDCAKFLSKYIPALSTISLIEFGKRNSRYSSERKFYLSRSYSPPENRLDYDYEYQEFKIYHVVDEFNENTIELHENKKYSERLGFRSKEECQKYCDWLNQNKKDYNDDYEEDDFEDEDFDEED
jgi:regulator of replication initiation timing